MFWLELLTRNGELQETQETKETLPPPSHLVIYNLFFNLYSNGRQLLLIKFTKKQNKELFQLPIIASTITSIVIFNIYARIYHTKWRAPGAVSWTPPPYIYFFL